MFFSNSCSCCAHRARRFVSLGRHYCCTLCQIWTHMAYDKEFSQELSVVSRLLCERELWHFQTQSSGEVSCRRSPLLVAIWWDCDLLTRSLEQSCFELASLRPATVFARLPHFELMQLSKIHASETRSFCSSLACEFKSNSRARPQSYLSPSVQTPTHDGGFHKKFFFLTPFPSLCLKESAQCFGSHKLQYHCNIKE